MPLNLSYLETAVSSRAVGGTPPTNVGGPLTKKKKDKENELHLFIRDLNRSLSIETDIRNGGKK